MPFFTRALALMFHVVFIVCLLLGTAAFQTPTQGILGCIYFVLALIALTVCDRLIDKNKH